MFLSICIPCYNRAYIIERNLKSLERQTCRDFEAILVDDGSTDNIKEVALAYAERANLRYVHKDNGGKHTALNKGIELAEGDYFMILDSDDYIDDKYVESVRKIIESEDYQASNVPLCGVIGKCYNITSDKIIGGGALVKQYHI